MNEGARQVVLLRPGDARRLPWKNGRGETLELAIWPRGASLAADDFHWRISRAGVVEDGPFSSFADCERALVVVAGDGLALDHGDAAPAVQMLPFAPHRFAGEWPTTARLLGGPVADFGVIWRRGVVDAAVTVTPFAGERTLRGSDGHTFVHLLAGRLETAFGVLGRGDSLWLQGAGAAAGEGLRALGATDTLAVVVALRAVRGQCTSRE